MRALKLLLIIIFLLVNTFSGNYLFVQSGKKQPTIENRNINRILINKLLETENGVIIDEVIERFRNQNNLKGLSVAIVRNEKLVFVRGYGFSNEEDKIKVRPENLFRVASVSKLITAVAVMKLVESGKITLHTPVFGTYGILNEEKFLKIKDKRLENIRIIDLLNHSGGWTQRYGDIAFLPKIVSKEVGDPQPVDIDSYVKFVVAKKVHFDPGTLSAYSNLGYMLLGKIISVASGMDYQEYVKEAVLKPCGIADMQLGKSYAEERLPNEVLYYQPEDAKPTEAFDGSNRYATKVYGGNDITLLGSAGGWLASSIDLMKLVVRIDNKKNVPDILASKSIIEMTKVNPDGLDPLGWRSTNENGEWWRTGTLNGTSALIKRQPDGFSWVILSNTSNYKGPRLAIEMDRVMTTVLHKVKEWPDLDLFAYYNN